LYLHLQEKLVCLAVSKLLVNVELRPVLLARQRNSSLFDKASNKSVLWSFKVEVVYKFVEKVCSWLVPRWNDWWPL